MAQQQAQGGSSSGWLLNRQANKPFGEVCSGDLPQTTSDYTGQRKDGTGLLYYHARSYDPVLGKFHSPNTIVPGSPALTVWPSNGLAREVFGRDGAGPADPQQLNRYSYAGNNPVIRTDPTGHVIVVPLVIAGAVIITPQVVAGVTAAVGVASVLAVHGDTIAYGLETIGEALSDLAAERHEQLPLPGMEEAVEEERHVPNPYGTRGGRSRQEKIAERIAELEGQGYEHVGGGSLPEEVIVTPEGDKSHRRVNITMYNPETGGIYREQVGRANQNGDPVSRERRALDDIETVTGQRPHFTPYD